ncbi:MAG: HNH endonuclease [Bryobacterales bacterium]|nr:HNH endonuclease [Bryobacterales bacterium]
MRPVRRGPSPISHDFEDYRKAKEPLVERLGMYCSYCERRLPTSLHVEHIQPKSLHPDLEGRWENFLLACVNCNSHKRERDVPFTDVFLPDRDNTFAAFEYSKDGRVDRSGSLRGRKLGIALRTLALIGLDRKAKDETDDNAKAVALDLVSQRMQTWMKAEVARDDLQAQPGNEALVRQVVELATSTGFFSIWMTVFEGDTAMRSRLIDAFAGTRPSGCFEVATTRPESPAPNPDALAGGGKI